MKGEGFLIGDWLARAARQAPSPIKGEGVGGEGPRTLARSLYAPSPIAWYAGCSGSSGRITRTGRAIGEPAVIRTIREADIWKMQTAAIYLRHPTTGRRITLLSMIHIGRADYYARLSELMEEHEGLVLFEGLGELTPQEVAALPADERRVYESLASLNNAYRRFAASLHLVAQPDAMPRPRPGWIRADLPVRVLLRRWLAARLPLIPMIDGTGRALESPFLRRATRLLLLQEPFILAAFTFLRGHTPGLGRLTALLIDERNAAALAAFDAAPPEQDVLVTYGAGHVPGLLAGFTTRGYRETARDWFTAHTERIPFSDMIDRCGDWFRVSLGRR
jgi:hypothetical protein